MHHYSISAARTEDPACCYLPPITKTSENPAGCYLVRPRSLTSIYHLLAIRSKCTASARQACPPRTAPRRRRTARGQARVTLRPSSSGAATGGAAAVPVPLGTPQPRCGLTGPHPLGPSAGKGPAHDVGPGATGARSPQPGGGTCAQRALTRALRHARPTVTACTMPPPRSTRQQVGQEGRARC